MDLFFEQINKPESKEMNENEAAGTASEAEDRAGLAQFLGEDGQIRTLSGTWVQLSATHEMSFQQVLASRK
jgi:hypothetical protein